MQNLFKVLYILVAAYILLTIFIIYWRNVIYLITLYSHKFIILTIKKVH